MEVVGIAAVCGQQYLRKDIGERHGTEESSRNDLRTKEKIPQ